MYKLADGSLSTDYKVGDEFEVVKEDYFYAGSIVKLIKVDGTFCPKFKLVHGRVKRDKYHFEQWSHLKPHRKQFTKADLKDGMVVTYRNGSERVVHKEYLLNLNEIYNANPMMGGMLDSYKNGLLSKSSHKLDIIRVSYMNEILWERKEETAEQKEIKRLRGVIEDAQKALSALERDK